MNPEFKVLTNVNESNLRPPIIQNRFRKLTLQSPKQTTTPLKLPEPSNRPQPKLTVEKTVDPAPVSPPKSQTETITNKLMLSSSSGNNTEQTNFINVETEPFTNPLRVESTENDEGSPKIVSRNANNNDLASQMQKLDVSRGSVELFSQFSSSSKLSLPRNRILSNKENIENISQRISNIRMTDHDDHVDLAETQPNTSSQRLGQSQMQQTLADTQLNSSPIVLSSDGEDSNDDDANDNENLLTEESEEDNSVIEILSDSSFEITDDRMPQNVSPINGQPEDITESVAQKLNHFFDNIPDINVSQLNCSRNLDSNTSRNESVCSEINVSETAASQNEHLGNESNILQLQASQLDENLDKSGRQSSDRNSSQIDPNEKDGNQKNETLNSSASKAEETSLRRRSQNNESDKSSAVDNESIHSEISPAKSSHQNQNMDETQMSVHQPTKRNEKIKARCNNVMTLNSPIINISAKVNINIRLSGFSSSTTSSDTDGTSQNADDPSEVSSKNNDAMPSEKSVDSSREFVGHCRQNSSSSKKHYVNNSAKHDTTDDDDDNDPHKHSSRLSTGSSDIIESSLIQSQGDDFEEIQNEDIEISGIRELVDTVKELTIADVTSTTNQDENDVSVSPVETSVEIDEIGEQLLTDVYGDAWRTPQLVKKCVSTKKKCLTEVPKRNRSLGFSFFKRDVPSELESTRITPCGAERELSKVSDQSEPNLLDMSNERVNEAADESSRIMRSHRKVAVNRILDYTDETGDEADAYSQSDRNKSNSDASFEPVKSSDEESDASVEEFVKPKRKRNKFVFLDLTCDEVIEDEDHESPDASAEELEKVCENFLQSLQTETIVQTPAPTKKTVSSSTMKRKLFTHNYDDQIPFEETKTPSRLSKNGKTIELKTPIPSYLIPPQFRDKTNAEVVAQPITPTVAHPSINSKINKTPRTPAWPVSSQICGFLESLDDQLIPVEHCHPDALKFRIKFKANRDELVVRLMKIFNDQVFDNKLKRVPVTWSNKLTSTAGYCRNRKIGGVRKCAISLSDKLLTSPGRVRDTLIHELCHAASWSVDGDTGAHGKVWKYWTERANKRIPVLPKIGRCHDYEVIKKYTYKCTLCGLKSQSRSKSKKVENIRCSKCHGPIEVFVNQQDKDGKVNLVPPKEPSTFAMYVKENYKFAKTSGVTHADVMKILSNNFGKLTVEEKNKYKK